MKYMGSKARISKYIAPIIQKYIDDNEITTYIEPFVGGANMIDKIKCEKRFGYDINEYLIKLLESLSRGWMPPQNISEEDYKSIKNNVSNYPIDLVGYVGFQLSYGAKWFGGYRRDKVGKRNYSLEAYNNVTKQSPLLKDIIFRQGDYKDVRCSQALIYCDPPYQGTTKYKDDFDHEEYWEWVRGMSKNNIVICSEYHAPDDFVCIWSKELTTGLDNKSRKKDIEKLFIHSSKIKRN